MWLSGIGAKASRFLFSIQQLLLAESFFPKEKFFRSVGLEKVAEKFLVILWEMFVGLS